MTKTPITLCINGEDISAFIEPRLTLADFVREAGLTGTHIGCEHGVCGACSIRVDGAAVRGCLMLAIQCEDAEIETVELVSTAPETKDLSEAFVRHNALQCGFCTSGMLLTAAEFLETNSDPTRDEVRTQLSGNYCRCTGYQSIVDAVLDVAERRRSA